MIENEGYPVEVHSVITDDGYLLTIHRIPGSPESTPIFLQHGLMASSFDWVIGGKKRFALAFLLADQGYDVWMGNARGNIYSRCHIYYAPSQSEFWDFSWQEMGLYDLPAAIDYIAETTNQNVTYVGHSMGTTMFFVMAIERPDIASKINIMFGLSPIVYMSNSRSPLRFIAPYIEFFKTFMDLVGIEYHLQHKELMYTTALMKLIFNVGCTLLDQQICFDIIFYLVGYNPVQFDRDLLPDILSHNILAGISTKTLAHYAQEANTGKFSYYDYGKFSNRQIYKNIDPPDFDISKIQVPIGILWSQNDLLADPQDVQKFYEKLPMGIFNHKVSDGNFSHIDFILAKNAYDEVYKILIEAIENFTK
ncbi:hypothetical protein QAD02_016166 [Eretmocerus hayati]|uniref:Uncharacterized protein n=1 Tax=Eretmocerus hayati TaxID=131215 RepID=A0ACC2P9T7_9HYME|nr:hypothetical protein QAD02_016166 [Eretmocerus hayati]